jgi:hypothetical protein
VPYARWGRDFNDEDLDDYFCGDEKPTETEPASAGVVWDTAVGPGPMTVDKTPTRFVGLRKNRSYDPDLLEFRDHAYVSLIKAMWDYLESHSMEEELDELD